MFCTTWKMNCLWLDRLHLCLSQGKVALYDNSTCVTCCLLYNSINSCGSLLPDWGWMWFKTWSSSNVVTAVCVIHHDCLYLATVDDAVVKMQLEKFQYCSICHLQFATLKYLGCLQDRYSMLMVSGGLTLCWADATGTESVSQLWKLNNVNHAVFICSRRFCVPMRCLLFLQPTLSACREIVLHKGKNI